MTENRWDWKIPTGQKSICGDKEQPRRRGRKEEEVEKWWREQGDREHELEEEEQAEGGLEEKAEEESKGERKWEGGEEMFSSKDNKHLQTIISFEN